MKAPAPRPNPRLDNYEPMGGLDWIGMCSLMLAMGMVALAVIASIAAVAEPPPWCPHSVTLLGSIVNGCR